MPLGDATLDAAVRYFGMHGLRSAALDDVARSADLDLRELRRRYPTSRMLALGIFERMLDILGEQLEEQSKRGAPLSERLQRWFELELQLLEPCKALVRGWWLESIHPLSPAAWLQGPLAFRYGAQLQREFELARQRGEISGWIWPAAAAGAFVGLRRSLVSSWLGDDSPAASRTLPLARAEIAAFVRLLAPWPGVEQPRASTSPRRAREPRALPAPIEPAEMSSEARSLEAAQAEAVQAVRAVQAEAVQAVQAVQAETAAVNAALAQAPAVLGVLAQPALEPEPLGSPLSDRVGDPDAAPLGASAPAPVHPGSEKAPNRSQRRARGKRSKH